MTLMMTGLQKEMALLPFNHREMEMKERENHFMVDIETTGVERGKDKILQVGLVEIKFDGAFWIPTGREFERTLHYAGQPENEFAKKHMTALYKKCNETPTSETAEKIGKELRQFIHPFGCEYGPDFVEPKFFIGWNASNFDMPFLFDAGMLTPSYYKAVEGGKERLCGDAHYRIYEQTGSVQAICDITGLDRKTIETLAMDLNPTGTQLPKGKEHDALYDCYKQIIMQNGLIKIGRMNIRK